tara:strand:+ start:1860 stop:1988 length:129 start_codon:yes stop_codon:yes gene_type:complete
MLNAEKNIIVKKRKILIDNLKNDGKNLPRAHRAVLKLWIYAC